MTRRSNKDRPMLTVTQKTLVQDTFATIAPMADDAAVLFYRRLFELDPALEPMFPGDMKEQQKTHADVLGSGQGARPHRAVGPCRDVPWPPPRRIRRHRCPL